MEQLQDKKKANRAAVMFVVKLLFFYFLFSQGNLFMNSVLQESGRFYNEFLAVNFNYIQALKTSLIVPAVWIIKLFGFYAIHNEMDVMVVQGPYLRINYACLGIGVMSFLIAFVIAFPAKLKSKWKLLVYGLIMIYMLNFTYHHEVFNILVYICVFAVLYYWIKKNTSLIPKEKK